MLTAIFVLNEYILKTFFPRHKIKAQALEAANHFVESFYQRMAQEDLNRNDLLSFQWNTAADTIKWEISSFGTIKFDRRNGEIHISIQDGNNRIRMHQNTFLLLCEYKESILYLMSFLETNSFNNHHGQGVAKE
ncbi:MAG: hypothetical protein N0E45_09505 [Candidatus Thiodiazotropha endolucinida]|nr:hypothetical protein [Candidatus Thiodiazotropha taylori]MCW4299883.1 hypothetical protein [Candidatus Thiodiazotropha endolucinida]